MASLGRVARVDRPSQGLLALSLRSARVVEALVLGSRAHAWGAGLVPARPRGAPADAFTQGLRRRLVGAEVTRIDDTQRALFVTLRLTRAHDEGGRSAAGDNDDNEPSAWLAADRATGGFWFGVGDQVVLTTHPVAPCPPRPADRDDTRVSRAELVVGGPALVQAASTELLENGRRALTAALAKSIKRLTRKRDAILDDARRADRAPGLRLEADLLLAHGSQLQRGPRGDGWVDVQDWSEDPPRPRRITLQHDEQPAGRAAKLYHQARRMERGARIAEERWAIAEEQLERVRDLHARCAAATTTAQVDELAAAALACGIRELDEPPAKAGGAGSKRRRGASDAARLPYRRFESSEGHPIWVGRSSRDNDELTLRHAKPHHLWLHVEGRSGSHVVVPLSRGATASSELLVDAAQLAAHFSGARDERVVEVIHAERRHVVKPRGYPAGAVRVDRRKTLLLRQEPGRLASLLARELRI